MPNYENASGVLKNKLGATSHQELERFSAKIVAARAIEIELGQGPKGKFDESHLRAIHRHLFQDVFEWAGRTRNESVRLSDRTVATMPRMMKAEGMTGEFFLGPQIAPALAETFQRLQQDQNLKGLTEAAFVEKAAALLSRLNSIHAFREGNGRTQRQFLAELAKESGRDLDFSGITARRNTEASIEAFAMGNQKPMQALIRDSMGERGAALRTAVQFLTKQLGEKRVSGLEVVVADGGRVKDAMFVTKGGAHFIFQSTESRVVYIANAKDMPHLGMKTGDKFEANIKSVIGRDETHIKAVKSDEKVAKVTPARDPVRKRERDNDRGR